MTVVAGGLFYMNGPLFDNLQNNVVHRAGLSSERRVLLRSGILTGANLRGTEKGRGALKKFGSHKALVLSNRFVVVSTVHPETFFEGPGLALGLAR